MAEKVLEIHDAVHGHKSVPFFEIDVIDLIKETIKEIEGENENGNVCE